MSENRKPKTNGVQKGFAVGGGARRPLGRVYAIAAAATRAGPPVGSSGGRADSRLGFGSSVVRVLYVRDVSIGRRADVNASHLVVALAAAVPPVRRLPIGRRLLVVGGALRLAIWRTVNGFCLTIRRLLVAINV